MRVILDECPPRCLGAEIGDHLGTTVARESRAGTKNDRLLARITSRFDAFIPLDKNLPARQATAALSFGVLVLHTSSNTFEALKPLIPALSKTLASLQPGQVVIVSASRESGTDSL